MKKDSDQTVVNEETKWSNKQEILDFGKKLVNKNLRTQVGINKIPNDLLNIKMGGKQRASIGNLLENYYYNIHAGNEARPDFGEAGVELKTTPVKKLANGNYSSKERLVLNMINYTKERNINFKESSFYKKNNTIMLFSYLHQNNIYIGDLKIKIADLLEYENLPVKDKKIIKSDWEKINQKINSGEAHNLSEGDTLYLGACTKSASSKNRTLQWNEVPAKPRAYSFKSGYMTAITRRLLGEIDKDVESIVKPDEINKVDDFEEYVISKFKPYIGKSVNSLTKEFKLDTHAKNKLAIVSRRIMGVSTSKIEEFEKADIQMKTIQVKSNGKPKESMSFPYFKFKELNDEEWDEDNNTLRNQLEKKFFFVVFKCKGDCVSNDDKVLDKVMFWTMPAYNIDNEVKKMWLKSKEAVHTGNLDLFPKQSDHKIIHVRPHGKNKKDVDQLPNGEFATKRCFWINGDFIGEIIN